MLVSLLLTCARQRGTNIRLGDKAQNSVAGREGGREKIGRELANKANKKLSLLAPAVGPGMHHLQSAMVAVDLEGSSG